MINVIAAVIQRRDEFLLCKRPKGKRHAGMFEFPGGKLHSGETLAEGIARELHEELGVEVIRVGCIRMSEQDAGSEFLIHFVDVDIRGEPTALEHEEVRWMSLPQMSQHLLAPSDARFVASLTKGQPNA
jgi:8-oxo-dGTP diphosphatase